MITRFFIFLTILWIPLQAQLPRFYVNGELPSKIKVPDSLKRSPYIELVNITSENDQKKGIITPKGKVILPVSQDSIVWLGEQKGILTGRPMGDSWLFGLRNSEGEFLLEENYESIQHARFMILTKQSGVYQLFDFTGKYIGAVDCDTAWILRSGDVYAWKDLAGSVFQKTSSPVYTNIKTLKQDSTVTLIKYSQWNKGPFAISSQPALATENIDTTAADSTSESVDKISSPPDSVKSDSSASTQPLKRDSSVTTPKQKNLSATIAKAAREMFVQDSIRKAYHAEQMVKFHSSKKLDQTTSESFIYADSIAIVNDSLIKVLRLKKWALYKNDGTQVLPFAYDSLCIYKNEFVKGITKDGEGIWTLPGQQVMATSDSTWLDEKNYFHLLKRKSGWKVCNQYGKFISDTAFAETGIPSNALLAVRRDSLWGFVHETGNWKILPKYKAVHDFKYGYSLVEFFPGQKYHYALIDRNDSVSLVNNEAILYFYGMSKYRTCVGDVKPGEPLRELYYPFPPYRYADIRPWIPGYFTTQNGDLKGVLDARGKEIIYCHEDTILLPTARDSVFLCKRKNGSIGVSDIYGNRNLPTTFRFKEVLTFKDGLARFKENGLYGFFDRYGNVIVSPQYATIREYSGNHVPVVLKNKWGYLDREEKLKIQPYYIEVLPVKNGLAIVRQGKKWEFLNTEGKKLNVTSYDKFTLLPSGKYLVYKGKKVGLTNPQGREIVFPKYDAIYELSDTTFAVRNHGYYGVLDQHENILINFTHAGAVYDSYNQRYYLKSEPVIIKVPNEIP